MDSHEVVLYSSRIPDIPSIRVHGTPLSDLVHITLLNLHNNSITAISGSTIPIRA
jgi:hypothetical protein